MIDVHLMVYLATLAVFLVCGLVVVVLAVVVFAAAVLAVGVAKVIRRAFLAAAGSVSGSSGTHGPGTVGLDIVDGAPTSENPRAGVCAV
jgi:opacity protein-like surface antigen